MKQPLQLLPLSLLALSLLACGGGGSTSGTAAADKPQAPGRYVVLNGTLSEIVCKLGACDRIVGTDVTSTYPQQVDTLPKVGHNRNLSAEGILSLSPDTVIAFSPDIKPELKQQIRQAGAELLTFQRELSVQGTKKLIQAVAAALGRKVPEALFADIEQPLSQIQPFQEAPKVFFVYARGAGTLMVGGKGTAAAQMIELAGAQNGASSFEDYKPLTAEALVAANPDALLMFDSGLESLEGKAGLKKIPGIEQTAAGQNEAVVTMDGQYLTGFGPRLGQAALELNHKLHQLNNQNLAQ